jgi:hypothetical protein
MVAVPGIARRRKRQVEARAAEREFMGGELAEQHAGLGLELGLDDRVGTRHVIRPELGMAGRADAGCVVDVLECVRHALHGPVVDPIGEIRVCRSGIGPGAISGHGNEAVDSGVDRGDARERVLGEGERGDRTVAQFAAGLGDGEFEQFRAGHDQRPRVTLRIEYVLAGSCAAVRG